MPWILNMPKFWIRESSEYANVTHQSEYAKISLGRVQNGY